MSLLIKNETIVSANAQFTGDILCENGMITEIGPELSAPSASEIIDATGKFDFPGFIDPHVHVYLPFMGTLSKDDYATGSKTALMGGTTALIEMCCPSRNDDPREAVQLWKSKAAGISSCDYTFHMGVTRFDDGTADALKAIVAEEGITSFKVFLAYKGAFGIEDTELYQTLSLARELGVVVTAHCENADLDSETHKKFVAEGKTGSEWHEPSRPIKVGAEGCYHLMTFVELTGAEAYVVHTSCIPVVEAITSARKSGDTYAQTRSFGGLCIADVVQAGFGRTGTHFWDFETQRATRDIVTMAKGIGNDCPLAAVVTTPEVARILASHIYFNTFGSNPVSMAQGRAILRVIKKEGLLQNSLGIDKHLITGFNKLAEKHPIIGEVRGKGLMLGVEFVKNRSTKERTTAKCPAIFEKCKDLGLLIGKVGLFANTLRIKPPMCVHQADADFMLEVIDETLAGV